MFRPTIQIDWYETWPFRIRSWPRPLVKFSAWLLRSNDNSFEASGQEEHDTAKTMACLYWVKSYYRKKNVSRKNGYLKSLCSLEAKPLILDQIWGHPRERPKKCYRMRFSALFYALSNAPYRLSLTHYVAQEPSYWGEGRVKLKILIGYQLFGIPIPNRY